MPDSIRDRMREAFDAYRSFHGSGQALATIPSGTNMTGVDMRGRHMGNTSLYLPYWNEVNLSGAHMRGSYLFDTMLRQANLTGIDLREAKLWSVDLSKAKLTGADMRGAHLNYANLHMADLNQADLSSADLSGVKYDKKTEFPNGFDPEAAGMVLDE